MPNWVDNIFEKLINEEDAGSRVDSLHLGIDDEAALKKLDAADLDSRAELETRAEELYGLIEEGAFDDLARA